MEAFAVQMTQKRKLDWSEVDDVAELKRLLSDKENQIVELKNEIRNLTNKNSQLQENKSPNNLAREASQLTDSEVNSLRKSLSTTILNQMVYKASLKGGSKSKISAEIPNLSLAEVKQIIGEKLLKKASNGPKKLQVKAEIDDFEEVFGYMRKPMRYSGSLVLDNMKLTFIQETRIFTASGAYRISK